MSSSDASSTPVAAAAAPTAANGGLSLEERYNLVRSVGEECIEETELRNLLEKKPNVICYDGFEPSGRLHIAQGIFKMINVNKCTAGGCKFVFWVADWFALMNDKMGGELQRIRIVGKYLVEVWKAVGMNMENVEFLWAADEINRRPEEYWKRVLDIGRKNTIARIKKCCQIMGRTEGSLTSAQILYPLMQCCDIFFLKADICQLGVDQRKVNMLAREYCDSIGRKLKPVILSHHMMSGLLQGQAKASKSNPDSAIFMEDSPEEVERKINNAYCPKVRQTSDRINEDGLAIASDTKNPCLDYANCIVFSRPGHVLKVPEALGGAVFTTYAELEEAFLSDRLSEAQLKAAVAAAINELLEPVRRNFATNAEARDLLEQVKAFRSAAAVPPAATTSGDAAAASSERVPTAVAWLPCGLRLSTRTAVDLIDALNDFVSRSPNHKAKLLLPTWGAFGFNEITGEDKEIEASLEYHAQLVRALGLSERVEIVNQGKAILANANDYWLNVIAAGRKFSLSDIETLWATAGGLANAGQVVGTLMRVADVAAVSATHVISTSVDSHLNQLGLRFYDGLVEIKASAARGFPDVLCEPGTPPTTADDVANIDDTDMDLRRKIKRAFAAPGDARTPVLDLAKFFIARGLTVKVTRSEANGGNKDFTDASTIEADYVSSALHPGDLKDAVAVLLLTWTEAARKSLNTPEVKKLATVLRNAEKKKAKGGAAAAAATSA